MKLFAHRHWITLHFFGKKLRLCARCTGIVLGFVFLRLGTVVLALSFILPSTTGLILAFSFAFPSIIDWVSQNMKFRHSNNKVRMLTGILEGCGIGLLSLTNFSISSRVMIITLIGASVIVIGNLKKISQKLCFNKNVDS